jgi:hypothetical protein
VFALLLSHLCSLTAALVPFPEARSKLVSAVAKELETFDTQDEFTDSYVKDHGLVVKTDLASESVVATRTSEGHKIQISFRAEALEEPEQEEQQEEGEQEQKMPEHRFFVDIQSPSGKFLRLECFNSPQGELEVGNMWFPTSASPNPATTPQPTPEQELASARDGLRVEELSEEASQALFDYLEALGVDDDLAVYVSSQAQAVRTQAMIKRIENLKQFAQ